MMNVKIFLCILIESIDILPDKSKDQTDYVF